MTVEWLQEIPGAPRIELNHGRAHRLKNILDITLVGIALLGYWEDHVAAENLKPQEMDGQA